MINRFDFVVLVIAGVSLLVGIRYGRESIAAIGLVLDIAGVLLLWRFGLPSDLKKGGQIATQLDVAIDPKEKVRFQFAKVVSHIAVLLIFAGFFLQFLGTIGPTSS